MKQSAGYTSFVNLFPEIIYDKNQSGNRSLDIWNSYRIVVNAPQYEKEAIVLYSVQKHDTLQGIANDFYRDTRLWWLIPLFNDVEDPFDFLDNVRDGSEGELGKIKLINANYLDNFLFSLKRLKSFDTINKEN